MPLSVRKAYEPINRPLDEYDKVRSTNIIHRQFIENALADTYVDKVCKDRRKRREIMFAKGKAGKGSKGSKMPKFTEKSKVRC